MADENETYIDDSKPQELRVDDCALLVVDMLNDFLTDGGVMALPGAEVIYGPLAALIAASRAAGMPVIYLNDCHRAGKYDSEFDKRPDHCVEGTWGAQVVDELEPNPEDYVIRKRRFSGFYQTDLQLVLTELEVRRVIVTGVMTNICVRSTVHDAFFLGYDTVVPRDCVFGSSQREQDSSLWDISTCYGMVVDSAEILTLMPRRSPT